MYTKLLSDWNHNLCKILAGRTRRAHPAVRRAAVEAVEGRTLMSAAAPNFVAVADGGQNFGDTRRALNYYDVTNVTSASTGVFNQTPALTIWTGYEITVTVGTATGRNQEEISGFDINPANGDTYMLSFDSGPTGVADQVGDTQGDYDLYRYNFAKAYSHQVSTARPAGIMYTDRTSTDFGSVAGAGLDYQAAYGTRPTGPTGLPEVDFTDPGVPDGRSNKDADPSNDFFWIDGLVDKVGEVARVGGSSTPFFDQQDIQFVDPQTLLLLENTTGTVPPTGGTTGTAVTQDYQIRTLERVAGPATVSGTTGGYNGNTSEAWQSFQWTGDNFVDMDNFAATGGLTEADGLRYVERDGVRGAWVSDRDGGGDDFSFFKLDFATRTAQKQELRDGAAPFSTGFALDEDPTVNPNGNTGDLDSFDVDQNGKLVITESGFNDTPKAESKLITRTVTNYNGGDSNGNARSEIVPGGWTATAPYTFGTDDDNQTTDSRYGVFNRGQNRIYLFDIDSGGTTDDAGPGVGNPQQLVADVYVIDAATGAVIYSELNAANHFLVDANKIRAFTLGDNTGDGKVQADDIDVLATAIRTPGLSALTAERLDLTGDNLLTLGSPTGIGSVTGDLDYLIRRVAATEYGDTDLNRVIDAADQTNLDNGRLGFGTGWAFGDLNGDGAIDPLDDGILDNNFLFNPTPSRV